MALRARFVGGRGSGSPGGGEVRERTAAEVEARGCLGRGAEEEADSALVESSGMMMDVHPDRAPTTAGVYLFTYFKP